MFESLVTYYSKVKRINRGYVTHYTIKLTLTTTVIDYDHRRDEDHYRAQRPSDYCDKRYLQFIEMGGLLSYNLFWTSDLWTHQPVSHRRKVTGFLHLLSAVLAFIFLARRIQPLLLSLVDREVEFCVLTI